MKFNVGDRVRGYRYGGNTKTGEIEEVGNFQGEDYVKIRGCVYHPKQCRHLKPKLPKKPQGARKVWIKLKEIHAPTAMEGTLACKAQVEAITYSPPDNGLGYVEYSEILPGQKLVSREEVRGAFVNAGMSGLYGFSSVLDNALTALGFEGEK